MVRVELEFVRREFRSSRCLDLGHVLAWREAGAVGDAEDVRVDRDHRLAEGGVEHDVGGLASDARQRLERLAVARHLAAVLAHQDLGERDDVLRLVVEKAERADVRNEAVDAEPRDRGRRVRLREELRGGLVHALVGRLRGEHDRDQQLERRASTRARWWASGCAREGARRSRAAWRGSWRLALRDIVEAREPRGLVGLHVRVVLEEAVRLRRPGLRGLYVSRVRTRSRRAPRRRSRRARRRARSPRRARAACVRRRRAGPARAAARDGPPRDADVERIARGFALGERLLPGASAVFASPRSK